ncbi:CTR9 [Candida pseudojiufengensis]|uniref:CTR9 n=1 Tax=Candida pseudojiufengensis TaxID=497109 RepID=UPI002223FB46|nr:CTR9 [Candida pseudojiufengensis]KAI5960735.1 CTR9 [Candida pseudojiufengensis]
MEEPVNDISFYTGKEGADNVPQVLDFQVEEGNIVSLNIPNDVPENPEEIATFFQERNIGKYEWFLIANAYVARGEIEKAMEFIRSAFNSQHFNEEDKKTFKSFLIWLHLKLIALGVDKNTNITQASIELHELTSKIQNDSQTSVVNNTSNLLSQAILSNYHGGEDDALEIFERILRRDQNNTFALLGKAQITLSKSKNFSLALKLYQQVLILNPIMKPDPRLGIGLCFWFLKDDKMAIQAWERSLELDPNNNKAKIFLNLAKFHLTFNNSLSDEEFLNNYKECIKEIGKLHKDNINDSTILLTLVSFYFSKQNYDTVEKIIKLIVNNITGDDNLEKIGSHIKTTKYESNILSECRTWIARISFNKGDFTQASKNFQEAIKLNESNIVAKLGLGQSQYNRGSVDEASLTFESILRSNKNCLEVNYSLGVLYSTQDSKRKKDMAIQVLERYIRLSNNRGLSSSKEDAEFLLNKEPITLNAYLILSKLYENIDINQSLNYLNKAIESRKQFGKSIPLEVYNNIGVIQFTRQNFDNALVNFQSALDQLEDKEFQSTDGDILLDLPQDLRTTLTYNLARSKEISNQNEAITAYETLLSECPHYFSAKLRILFLACISKSSSLTTEDIKTEIDDLLDLNASDLEIRSFYGWFIKNFGKKLGLKSDIDTNFQKNTLVEYDKHDCYALISLANIYCTLARDLKGSSSLDEKKKNYYIRAIELYTKVLTIDPKNVYAAQGLAITYIENKESNKGLDILRKIRDSLNDISVYLNLGHVLCDVKQYGKAIENYELALGRYTDGKDIKILTFLGRAWYLRGSNDQNLAFFKRSLDYTKQALELTKGSKSTLLFNMAYVQFQIADFITKQNIQQRKPQEIHDAIQGLNEAIDILMKLASDEEKHPPYPKDELRGRANLGSSTLLNRLTNALDETKENIAEVEQKLQTAKELREKEKETKLKEEQNKLNELKAKEAELAKQRAALQEQAQQWAEESRQQIIVNEEEENDDKLFDEENELSSKKKGKGGKNKSSSKKKKKKSKKIVSDSESEAEMSDEEENSKPKNGSSKKRKTPDSANTGDDEDDENTVRPNGKKKKPISNEFIHDSDEDSSDDDLFGDDKEEKNNEGDE